MDRSSPLIALTDVTKTYRMGEVEVHALRGVSLDIAEGEFTAIMGHSGSGKSTLMNLLGCLDRPTAGRYLLDGRDVSGLSRDELAEVRNRTIGFVFQSFNLLSRTSALENVELPLLYAGKHTAERRTRAAEALARVGLADRAHHHPNQMSGGQQQRVAIARALVSAPRVILADEPTGNLDSRTSVEVMALFQELGRAGITVILVTHEPDVSEYASRIVVVRDGRILSDEQRAPRVAEAGAPRGGGRVVNWLQTFRVALRALTRNKTRSFLTTLGVVIGVSAVIAMVAIGDGARVRVEQAFASMGSNMLIVLPGSTSAGGAMGGFGSQPTLTWGDLTAIQKEIPSVRWAAPALRAGMQILWGDGNWSTSVTGTTPDYFAIRSWPVAQGLALSPGDVEAGSKVVVLGRTVVERLFGVGVSPLGQAVRLKNVPFTVVGVLQPKGQSPMGQDYDDAAFVPVTTFQQKLQGGLKNYVTGPIMVSATGADTTERAERQVRSLLRDRHRLAEGIDDDFSIRNLAELASAQQEGTKTLTTLLAAIAAVSLLVGGIGIMNIMLVSVTERTREIGVRMAVGAKGRDIRLQFLVEALVLALAGGLVGVMLGAGVAWRLATSFGWSVIFRPDVILIAVGFSGLVGIGFGLYPAHKASRLDPINALRFE